MGIHTAGVRGTCEWHPPPSQDGPLEASQRTRWWPSLQVAWEGPGWVGGITLAATRRPAVALEEAVSPDGWGCRQDADGRGNGR